jgi:hypothetical protein
MINLKEKIDLIASYTILSAIIVVLFYLYPKNPNSWIVIVLISFAATIIFYRILGGISEGSSLTLNGMKIGGSVAIFTIVLYLLSNLIQDHGRLSSVKAFPSEDKWIAIDRKNGSSVNFIDLRQDTMKCGRISPNFNELNLSLNIDSENNVYTDSKLKLGVVKNLKIPAELKPCNFSTTDYLEPAPVVNFEVENNIYVFSLKFGFCLQKPGTLFFKIKNNKNIEAKYEDSEGQLIQHRGIKTFYLNNKKYFITCTDYDNFNGNSKFLLGIIN